MYSPRRLALSLSLSLAIVVAGSLLAWRWWAESTRVPRPLAEHDELEWPIVERDRHLAAEEPAPDLLVAGKTELYLVTARDPGGGTRFIATSKVEGDPRLVAHLPGVRVEAVAWAADALWAATWSDDAGQPTQGAVVRVPVGGGAPRRVATGLGRPRDVACDGRWLFVVHVDPTGSGLTRPTSIERAPAEGGDRVVIGRSEGDISNVALDDDRVYWADQLEGTIVAAPKAGGEAQILARERGLPQSVRVAGGALFWVERRDESLWTLPREGGSPTRIAQDFAGFAHLVVRRAGPSWSNEAAVDGRFRVFTVPSDGGLTAPVSDAVDEIDALATDGVNLFWARSGEVATIVAPGN